eukprot:356543-Chlamydomonas_euryale.AAC.15
MAHSCNPPQPPQPPPSPTQTTAQLEERVLGEEHPGTLTMVHSVAYMRHCTGDLAGAEALFRRALRGRNRALGPDHPDTLASLSNLATLLYESGKLREAEGIFERAMLTEERVLGPDHPQTLVSMNNLAAVLHKQVGGCQGVDLWGAKEAVEVEKALRRMLLAHRCSRWY